jgi:hypothetical protein
VSRYQLLLIDRQQFRDEANWPSKFNRLYLHPL